MIRNPFSRKHDPLDEVREQVQKARAEAFTAASSIRDSASKVADALDTPEVPSGRKLPVAAALAAAGLAVAILLRKRSKGSSPPPHETAPPSVGASGGPVPAGAGSAERPRTAESKAAAGETDDADDDGPALGSDAEQAETAETAESKAAEAGSEEQSKD